MEAELIELSSFTEPLTNGVVPQQSNFAAELLMNTDKTSNKQQHQSKSEFEDITSLENELNSLVLDAPAPAPAPPLESNVSLSTPQTPTNNSTWDGYTKVTNIFEPSTSSASATQTMTKDELLREKFKYLRKLESLETKGVSLTKKYSMDSPLCEMQGEYEMILDEKAKQNSVKFQSNMLMAIVNGIEYLNGKFDPFDIKLDGWSEQVNENLTDYDDVFGELHEKYKNKASLAPELKLMFQLAGSGLMIHMTNTMFKSSMPVMDDILRQNPDLMKQFQNAAVKTMSENSPGFSGFVNNVSNNRYDPNDGFRPGNNNNNFATKSPLRPDMKGPTDINDILSGLKTRTVNVENFSNNNSSISLSDAKDLTETPTVKKNRRKAKSEKNTVSIDI